MTLSEYVLFMKSFLFFIRLKTVKIPRVLKKANIRTMFVNQQLFRITLPLKIPLLFSHMTSIVYRIRVVNYIGGTKSFIRTRINEHNRAPLERRTSPFEPLQNMSLIQTILL